MFHLVMQIRRHRTPLHADPVNHEYPAETVEEAVALVKKYMRDNYADPFELQYEDRSTYLDTDQLTRLVNGEALEVVTGGK